MATAQPEEIYWVITTLVAIAAHAYSAIDAYLDLRSVWDRDLSGAPEQSAIGRIRSELLMIATQFLFGIVGVLSLFRAANPNRPPGINPLILLLMAGQGLLAVNSLLNIRSARRVRREARAARKRNRRTTDEAEVTNGKELP